MIDLALANDNQVFVQPLVNEHPDHVLGMLRHPRTLATFSDSGAHVCQEMGSSLQTHMLSYWVRGEAGVHARGGGAQAHLRQRVGLGARTTAACSATGYRADLVLFDDRARAGPRCRRSRPTCPGGARRLVQKAEGIAATIVNGEVTLENGRPPDGCPGLLCAGRARGRTADERLREEAPPPHR